MRTTKDQTNLFFDGFKHFKNNISNLVLHELPVLCSLGADKYFDLTSANYKSKYPDMRKIGLIDYKKLGDMRFELNEQSKEILEYSLKSGINLSRVDDKRLTSIGKFLYDKDYFTAPHWDALSKLILDLELNYYDDGVSIRPYFILLKIIIKNNIKVLTDEILLDILSQSIQDSLQLKYVQGSFEKLPTDLQDKVKRPKSYIIDFIKFAKIINNQQKVIVDVGFVSQIIMEMNEYVSNAKTQDSQKQSRCGTLQSEFRNKLLEAYDYRCALTGQCIGHTSAKGRKQSYLLDAAHIIPYADGGSFSVTNGILLSPEIHTLYDSGYITFDYYGDDLVCIVTTSPRVFGLEYLQNYHMKKLRLPKDINMWPDINAIEYRVANYFFG